MLDFIIQIPGTHFLFYYALFALICISVAKLYLYQTDRSIDHPLPSLTAFNPLELAILKNNQNDLIHVTLFYLWQKHLLQLRGRGTHAKVKSVPTTEPPTENIAKQVYLFAQEERRIAKIVEDKKLKQQLRLPLKSIQKNLEESHLKQTGSYKRQSWLTIWLVSFLLIGAAGIKIYFGIRYGKPFAFIAILMAMSVFMTFYMLTPSNITRLGQRYLKRMESHFAWLKTAVKEQESLQGIDPSFAVILYGTGILAGTIAFSSFAEATSYLSTTGSDVGSGSDSGGDAGSGCGGGGGCGGCGGGG